MFTTAIAAAAVALAHVPAPNYQPRTDNVLACVDESSAPLAIQAWKHPDLLPADQADRLQKQAGCMPLFNRDPVRVDFVEKISFRAAVPGGEFGGTSEVARIRQPLDNGADLFLYVLLEDLKPVSSPAP